MIAAGGGGERLQGGRRVVAARRARLRLLRAQPLGRRLLGRI